ncbi:unnamed protein product [Dibothriocephalus latus]|uniref:Protein xylosyltransferase n=1 Tax=Dibothriocephalus latus TaxID=60516 RepID=A0A3P7LAY3_DIBLA|nr:unnamed protein product [Dibothriocephalus latus]
MCFRFHVNKHKNSRFQQSVTKSVPTESYPEEKNKASRCAFLLSNNTSKDHHEFKRLTPLHSTKYFLSLNKNSGQLCNAFKRALFPEEVPITQEELAFPLAFSISVFTSLNQSASLLRLIHRPHNFYVIHVDRKTSLEFYEAVQEIAKCFGSNVVWLKGEVHIVLLREFVEFMHTDKKAIEFRDMLFNFAYHRVPDEQFYPTLAYNP